MHWERALPVLLVLACSQADPAAPNGGPLKEPGQAASAVGIPVVPSPEAPPTDITPAALPPGPTQRALPRPFSGRLQIALGARPTGVEIADLDGDGIPELLATTEEPGELRLWRRVLGGLSPTPRRIPCGDWPLAPRPASAGALGAKGLFAPVVVASRASREIALLRAFDAPLTQLARLDSPPRAFDCAADAIAVATDMELVFLDQNGVTGSAPFADRSLPRAMCLLQDATHVVIAFQEPPSLAVWARGESNARTVLPLPFIPRDVCQVDLDGDSDLELGVACGEEHLLVFGWKFPGGVSAALDADAPAALSVQTGKVPLALASASAGGSLAVVSLYGLGVEMIRASTTGGALPSAVARAYSGQSPVDLALGDLDGDGRDDTAIANRDSTALSVMVGNEQAAFGHEWQAFAGGFPVSVDVWSSENASSAGARNKVVVACSKDSSVNVLEQSDGERLSQTHTIQSGPAPRLARWVDLDQDAVPDLAWLWSDAEGTRLALRRATSSTSFETRDPSTDKRVGVSASDLLVVPAAHGPGAALPGNTAQGPKAQSVAFLMADPDAGQVVFIQGESVQNFAVPSAPRALAWIQFDADPEPELAVALGSPGPRTGVAVLEFRHDSNTTATAPAALVLHEITFVPSSRRPVDLLAIDLDRDSREDLVVLTRDSDLSPAGTLETYVRRDGAVCFAPGSSADAGLMPHHLAACELDGERYLAVPSQNLHAVLVWRLVSGSGRFALERLDDLGAHLGCMDLDFADFTGDGKLDLIVANGFSDDLSILPAR